MPDLSGEVPDRDMVRGWVLGALGGTKNNSAPGLNCEFMYPDESWLRV